MTTKLLKVKAHIDDIFLDMVFTEEDGTSFSFTTEDEDLTTITTNSQEQEEIEMVVNYK